MSWSNRLMASLDARTTVLQTARGDVQLARDGQGPPVLVSHGGPGGFDLGLAWCRHLRDGGCELLAPSRPGYLRTPLQSGRSPESQADLYAAILDVLHIEQATIVGFSSGGPSAAHFGARHPDRTTALILEAAILLPLKPPINALQRATLESTFLVWLSYQIAGRMPKLMARFSVDGMSAGLTKEQKRAAANWIESDPTRLERIQEMSACTAPQQYRRPGWANDKANEAGLAPLPFADIATPTLIAHGANEGIVPVAHATNAADQIPGAELILVAEGHHALPLSRNYRPIAARQLELANS
jgi:pimeloyl-ACP methyl ester carboxylesterase